MIRETLRALLICEIVLTPFAIAWVTILCLRIHRHQEAAKRFLDTWGDRTPKLDALIHTLAAHDQWERARADVIDVRLTALEAPPQGS